MITLEPRIVFSLGIPSSGKSTALKEVTKTIPNAFYLDRDDIINGLLHVSQTSTDELPKFEEYVKNDDVFPNHARYVNTPFGEMIKIYPLNAFNRRHGRDQTYLIQFVLARRGLDLGKVPILDCFLPRQIKDGTLKKILDQDLFSDTPKFLIHFAVEEEECYQRCIKRVRENPEEEKRTSSFVASREEFSRLYREKFDLFPPELKEYQEKYNFLTIDTTYKPPEEVAKECIKFIS